jgi:hypothetical protein
VDAMLKKRISVLILFAALMSLPGLAQKPSLGDLPPSPVPPACGDLNAKFEVKTAKNPPAAEPEAGKALVYFIEEDINTELTTHTSRVGIDGKWMGATYGSSYIFFSVNPGVRHVCATTQTGMDTDDVLTSLAHFTA